MMMFGNNTIVMGLRSSSRRPHVWAHILDASEGERAGELARFFSEGYTLIIPFGSERSGPPHISALLRAKLC